MSSLGTKWFDKFTLALDSWRPMTREERDKRWQEIFDQYDKAVAEARNTTGSFREHIAPLMTAFIDHLDAIAQNAERIANAVHQANHAALALYRDERENNLK